MTNDPYSLRHQAQRSASDADQVEFSALRNGSSLADSGIYDERMAGAMDDYEVPDGLDHAPWQDEDLKNDSAVGLVHEEIERRRDTMGAAYPFRVRGATLDYVPNGGLLYEFLLAICNAETITSGRYVRLPRLFERLSARLVAAYLGDRTRFLHTGAPREEDVGRSFRQAMLTLAEATSEWQWGPDEDLPEEPANGDSGCDFVVWPAPPDGRPIGQLFFLGQCACGNDWDTKFNDLTLKRLSKWFNPLSVVDPVRCFATPHHVTDSMLREASREAGYVFDRARLASIAHRSPDGTLETHVQEEMRALVDLVVGT